LYRLMHFAKSKFFLITSGLLWGLSGSASAQSAADQASLAQKAAIAPAPGILAIPAKKLFGGEKLPAKLPPNAIGDYSKGCMAGAAELPINGPAWQAMRLSRNRNWGLPQTVSLVERLAIEAKKYDGWNGLLVGDMAQPRGGPMLTGHASHQIGLDADIWFTPMPGRILSGKERETLVPLEMVKNHSTLNQDNWSESRARIIKRAASYPEVGRIFVHPPIKAALCKWAANEPGDKSWLAKVRPLFGHTFHFHIRLNCPPGMKSCKNQWKPAPKDGTGCGDELAYCQKSATPMHHPMCPLPP
jgi:penicillin-insensitive murein DD-endopeptidase